MKTIILVMFLLVSISASAEEGEKWKGYKDKRAEFIGKRIAILETAKSCFESADSKEAVQTCHKDMKEKRKALKAEAKMLKQDWKAMRK